MGHLTVNSLVATYTSYANKKAKGLKFGSLLINFEGLLWRESSEQENFYASTKVDLWATSGKNKHLTTMAL